MRFYAYCLTDALAAESALAEIKGITGERPLFIVYDEVAVVVSEFEAERVDVSRENVLAHERVVSSVFKWETPLPFRFGTVVGEERLRAFVSAEADSLMRQLERVRGCVEMSVKMLEKSGGAQQAAHEMSAQKSVSAPLSGTAFLEMKRRELATEEMKRERAHEVSEWLAENVKGLVREAEQSLFMSGSLLVSASHLVERMRLEEYRARVRALRRERSELHFLTSGPWPPYSFSHIKS